MPETPCEFFLWGYMKSKIYTTPPRDMNNLRYKTVREANAIKQNPDMVKRAVRDMIRRARECIRKDERHVRGSHSWHRFVNLLEFLVFLSWILEFVFID